MAPPFYTTPLRIQPSGQACGATVSGVDLSRPLRPGMVETLRAAWLEHRVLAFPGQALQPAHLEQVATAFGGIGDDPYLVTAPGQRVVVIERRADETTRPFGVHWHSDWSFTAQPPAGTGLYGVTVPPAGGDTRFADQHAALDAMPDRLRARIDGRMAIHSGRMAFAPDGAFGTGDLPGRSMRIRCSSRAQDTQLHPLIRAHPETGRLGLFGCFGYIVGIEGMDEAESGPLLRMLYAWQTREAFQYRHRWQAGTLVIWDNRAVIHAATGGYDGHARVMHRITIAAPA